MYGCEVFTAAWFSRMNRVTCALRYFCHAPLLLMSVGSTSAAVSAAMRCCSAASAAAFSFSASLGPQATSVSAAAPARINVRMAFFMGINLDRSERKKRWGSAAPALAQRLLHRRMDEAGNIAAEARDFAHQRRGNETVL